MESQPIYYPQFYGDLKQVVFAPQLYINTKQTRETGKKDPYSQKIYFSKPKWKENHTNYFVPKMIDLFEKIKSNVPKPKFILTLPSHEKDSKCSQTMVGVAQKLATHLKIEYVDALDRCKTIKKSTDTETVEERLKNVKDSLKVNNKFVEKLKQSDNVLILDDVKTTGISMMEATKVLKEIGIKSVTCLAFGINA